MIDIYENKSETKSLGPESDITEIRTTTGLYLVDIRNYLIDNPIQNPLEEDQFSGTFETNILTEEINTRLGNLSQILNQFSDINYGDTYYKTKEEISERIKNNPNLTLADKQYLNGMLSEYKLGDHSSRLSILIKAVIFNPKYNDPTFLDSSLSNICSGINPQQEEMVFKMLKRTIPESILTKCSSFRYLEKVVSR